MTINYTKVSVRSKENPTMRGNLHTSSHYEGVNDFNSFQRMLMKANGTVTAMLEAYLAEPIQVVKLSENLTDMELKIPNIQLNKKEKVISRRVLLKGEISRRNFIYADSLILINNLEERFSNELLNTKKPIGKLWSEQKVETFKEIIDSGKEPANELSNYFCIEPEDILLYRTYSVSSQGKVTMIITEKFPDNYFSTKVPFAS